MELFPGLMGGGPKTCGRNDTQVPLDLNSHSQETSTAWLLWSFPSDSSTPSLTRQGQMFLSRVVTLGLAGRPPELCM